jgi:hypothetical protein
MAHDVYVEFIKTLSPEQACGSAAHLMRRLRDWGEPVPETNAIAIVLPLYRAAMERRPEERAAMAAYVPRLGSDCIREPGDSELDPACLSLVAIHLLPQVWQLLQQGHTTTELQAAIEDIGAAWISGRQVG